MRWVRWVLGSAFLVLLIGSTARANPGNLDVDFGGTGSVTVLPQELGNDIVAGVDSARRVVVAGTAFASGSGVQFVERLRVDGGQDSGFGPFPLPFSPQENPQALVVLGGGDVVIGGEATTSQGHEWALKHVTSSGTDAQGFNALIPMGDPGAPTGGVTDLVYQADGEPVAGGTAQLNGAPAIGLLRTIPQSYVFLDTSFSSDGKLLEEVPGATASFEDGLACATPSNLLNVCAPGSKLLVASEASIGGVVRIVVERFNTDGTLDRTFGGGSGAAILGPLRTFSGANGVFDSTGAGRRLAVDSRGRPVVAMGRDIERLNPDGTPDTTFGQSGVIGLEPGFEAEAVVITPQDGVLVAVDGFAQGTTPGAVRRYTSTGAPDTAFGAGNGIATTGGTTFPFSLALTNDAKILVAGGHSGGQDGRDSVSRLLDVAISPPVVLITPRLVSFQFTLSAPEPVGIFVERRVHGRLVAVGRVPLGHKTRGRHRVRWRLRVNGRRLPAGVYYVRLRLLNAHGRPFEVTKAFRVRVRARR
jgi:uncharacterized delta-60 repeat protein